MYRLYKIMLQWREQEDTKNSTKERIEAGKAAYRRKDHGDAIYIGR